MLTAATYNAGHNGRAFLIPTGNRTVVRIEVSGVTGFVARPVHLYTFIFAGSCGARGPTPAYALTDVVLASPVAHPGSIGAFTGPMTISNAAPVPIVALRATPHAIVVKTAPADGNHALFCGDVV